MTYNVCRASLKQPPFTVHRMTPCGGTHRSSLSEYLEQGGDNAIDVIYVHGNRMSPESTIRRAAFVYRNIVRHRPANSRPIRFLAWSWPSERDGLALRDARSKAKRTDAQGLYLAWLLRELHVRNREIRMVSFSFGGRICTGALHALAGGTLQGRRLPGESILGAAVGVGLLAPALDENWLRSGRYHGLATKNINHLTLLFNQRDIVLKRYPLLNRRTHVHALGFRGPRRYGRRYDGSQLPVVTRDCSDSVGLRHDEASYYTGDCVAGRCMYQMVSKSLP